ncbi:MAG: hypothetical protein DMG58_18210 [Acidobacteria bacterium]|nr:MAG: hypothetical protein DMG58_18210 [Acidobacteriota bacterium]
MFAVAASSNQINVLAPTELPEFGNVSVQVIGPGGSSSLLQVQMAPTAPGIFRLTDPSGVVPNNAAVLFANTAWLALPDSLATALHLPENCSASGMNPASYCAQPAHPGDYLQVFVTGLG